MSYVKSSETETWTEYNWLERHVAGFFRLFENFPLKVEFGVVGLGKVEVHDHDLTSYFENEYNPVWMVFQINGEFYKIEGSKDSYGGSEWNQYLTKVKKKEKVTYEYA
jgi:hypothetical protein